MHYYEIPLPDAEVTLFENAFDIQQRGSFYSQLIEQLNWRQETISLFGKSVKSPRLQAWYGDVDCKYSYSGIQLTPKPWCQPLLDIKQHIEELSGHRFNSVLANLYRDGSDSMGWHSDDEQELGSRPVIASVSFGQAREFLLQHKKTQQREKLLLSDGSLLIMSGTTQEFWRHAINKSKKVLQPRVNLTYRNIVS